MLRSKGENGLVQEHFIVMPIMILGQRRSPIARWTPGSLIWLHRRMERRMLIQALIQKVTNIYYHDRLKESLG